VKITIAQRFHPFSHDRGTRFLLPQTSLSIQVFPTRLFFTDLEGRIEPFFLSFDVVGPIVDFTAELDLEQGVLRVFGMSQRGFMRYLICAKKDGVWLTMEKTPQEEISCRLSSAATPCPLLKGESLLICVPLKDWEQTKIEEKLSLGEHKAQNWELIRRRLDFKEIFPLWLFLGSGMIAKTREEKEGNDLLLEECHRRIEQGEKEKVLEAFQNLFLAAFEGVLVPRLYDTEHQGILPEVEEKKTSLSPLPLLTKGASLIRSLFVQETQGLISILPCLPPQFHCGRMIGVKTSENFILSIEWTKKSLRRMQISSLSGGEIHLKLPKEIRSCRVKKGRRVIKKLNPDSNRVVTLSLVADETLHLDRFDK
jgi:hypothetical protein